MIKKTDRALAKIADLKPAKYNPRKISRESKDALKASIQQFGMVQDIVVNRRNNVIIGGHQRIDALRALGEVDAPVNYVDLNEIEEKALNVALNSQHLAGEYIQKDLNEILSELNGSFKAFHDLRFAELFSEIKKTPVDPDAIPGVRRDVDSVAGVKYELGPHRLICGDSTKEETWSSFLGEEKLQCVWTDPPYGVSYVGGSGLTIENDDLPPNELRDFLMRALNFARLRCVPGASWYVASPAGELFGEFGAVLGREGLGIWKHTLVWVKDRLVLGRSDYHYRHEPIFYGWVPGGSHYFVDERTHDSVIEIARPTKSQEHPTMKPVELIRRCLHNSAKPGWLVGDPFGGSGSMLIAADMEGQRARLIELSPQYCDVIRRRWTRHAKETGQSIGTGGLDG